ncbi:MAG: secretin N-terminal domain-containing protein, partial [Planctomycetota bacterium]
EGSVETASRVKLYTIEGMPAASAMTILSTTVPQARVSLGTDPQQLVVWARPADHEAIRQVVEELATAATDQEMGRTAAVYTLESLTATSAMTFLTQVVPQAQLSLGSQPDQLIAWAMPSDHKRIESTLLQIDVEGAGDTKVVVYTLEGVCPTVAFYVFSFLTSTVPGARFTPGAEPGQLVAWATPKDHEEIATLIEQLTAEPPPEKAPKAVVYGLKSITAASAMQVLQQAVPRATFTPDTSDAQRLTVLARRSDHETITAILEEIDIESPSETMSTVEVYTLDRLDPRIASYVFQFLATAVPDARFTPGVDPGQVVAWASPKDHEQIGILIEQLSQRTPPERAPRAIVYTLKSITATAAMDTLQTVVPEANFNTGEDPQRLIAWARPSDHEMIESILQEIDVQEPAGSASTAVVYGLQWITPANAVEVLQQAVPDAQITTNTESNQVIAWARPSDHERIETALKEIDIEGPADAVTKVVAYSLEGMESRRAYYTMSFIASSVPEASVTLNTDSTQLIAWARPKEHERIAELIEQVLKERPELAKKTVVYTLQWTTADKATEVLQEVVRGADFSVGEDPQQLIAMARPREHEVIQRTLEEIDVEPSPETASKALVYRLKSITAAAAMEVLQTAIPEAKFNTNEDPQRLTAWARPSDHKMIDGILEEIDVEEPAGTASKAVVYGLEWATAANAVEVLQKAVPDAQITTNTESNQVIAWARPNDHERIKNALEQIDVEGPPGSIATVALYPLEGMETRRAIYALRFLMQAIPEANITLTADSAQLVVWARPKDHKLIEGLVERLLKETPELARQAVVYSLKFATAAGAIQALGSAVPEATLTPGADENQLVAFARPSEHEKIEQILEQMDREPPPETEPRAVAYTLRSAGMIEAMQVLRTMVPRARLTMGAEPHQLIAWARPADHEIIEEILEKMAERGPDDLAARVVVYTLEGTDAQTAIGFLETAVPEAQFSVGSDPRRVIAWALPADHEVIEKAITEMSKEESPETAPRVVVYDLEATGAANAIQILQAAVPDAKLGVGSDPGKLVAWARPDDHEVIRAAVEQFEADSWLEGNRIISVYPIKSGDAESLLKVLDPVLKDHAEFVVDSERNSLIVWTDAKHHEAINKTIEQFVEGLEGTQEMTSIVYRLNIADPSAALSVLQTLVPGARLALDPNTQSIVAGALPEDHAKIKATLDEMDREDAEGQRPILKMHRVETGDVNNVYRSLTMLFQQDPTVQLSADPASDSIVAVASPLKHEKIEELIKEVEKGILLEADTTLVLYPMRNIDTTSAMEILNRMLEKRGARADLSLDPRSNQLVAITRSDHHELIRETLETLRVDESDLEIYDLQYVDPLSAEMAIGSEFPDEGLLRKNAPQVDTDPITQQLFVRASPEQHERIRKLLIKMGETKLGLLGDRGTETMRVIPFHGDIQGAIEKIQSTWPDLGKRIRIVTPTTVLPPPAKPEAPAEKPAEPKPEPAAKPEEAKPAPKETPPAKPEPKPEVPAEKPAEPKPEPAAKPEEAKPAEPAP